MSASRAVLWDMDGTLIDSEELHWISWRTTMANEGIAITREQFLASFGQRNDSIIPRWLGAAATPERIERISKAKEELYRHLVRTEGMSPEPGVARPGCTGFTRRDGFRQSPPPRRERISMSFLMRCQRPRSFKVSSRLTMCTEANQIPRCT